jgi:hypothetical protein
MTTERTLKSSRRSLAVGAAVLGLSVGVAGTAAADPSPTGSPGQPGAPGTTCSGPAGNANSTPGNAVNAGGSVFNPSGTAGTVYAGNPGTPSLANANSPHAVAQYDIACFQQTSNPGHS